MVTPAPKLRQPLARTLGSREEIAMSIDGMFQTPEELDEEIEHQRGRLRQNNRNLRLIEDQIDMFGAAFAPIPHLNQREAFEAKRTELLQTIQRLESQRHPIQTAPPVGVTTQLLVDSLPTG